MLEAWGRGADPDSHYDRMPCGLLTAAPGGAILLANQTLCRWLGAQAEDLVAKRRFQDLVTMGGKIFLQTHISPLLDIQRSVAEVKLEMLRADGSAVPVLVNISRVGRPGEELDECAVMLMSDRHKYERELLEARRRAEQALKAKDAAEQALRVANRRKDEFLATLAHELRDPLGAMSNAIELLRRSTGAGRDERASESAHASLGSPFVVLDRQLARASRLTDDLLDISRIAEGKIEIRRQSVELQTILNDVVVSTHARFVAGGPTHSLNINIPSEPVFLDVDPVRIAQVIQNLLNNALRYTPPGGNISVTARTEGNWAVIQVVDDGIGIADDGLETIFEMFAQAPAGKGHSLGGLGIGLSLVRALVELHGGSVRAYSDGAGTGSTFEVRLPLANRCSQ